MYRRRMKKKLSSGISMFVVFSLFFSISQAATKAGTSCTKIGSISIVSGKKFTCVRSGKKLIWDKGAVIPSTTKSNESSLVLPINQPKVKNFGGFALTESKVNLNLEASGFESYEINLIPINGIGNTYTSGIQNGSSSNYSWQISNLSCGTKYEAKIILWSELDGKGTKIEVNNNQIEMDSCSSSSLLNKVCTNWGSKIPDNAGWFECRYAELNSLKYVHISNNPIYNYDVRSPEPLTTCQVPDASPNPNNEPGYPGYKIGRKENSNIPTSGKLKIALIGVDYPDLEGIGDAKTILESNAALIKKWFDNFTNGKVKVEIQVYNKWLRAPRDSSYYNWGHPGASNVTSLSDEQLVQDYVNISDQFIDYKDIGALFVDHPTRINKIQYGIMRMIRVKSSEGEISPFAVSMGSILFSQQSARWAVFVHELMHPMGVMGHAPGNGWPFYIMTAQSGQSLALSTWDRILMDWIDSTEVYCDKLDSLRKNDIPLASIDGELHGFKSVIIKLSDHEALVIESRRKDYWSTKSNTQSGMEFEDGFAGVMIYKVDTAKRNDRTNESNGDNGNDPRYDKFAYFLKISETHINAKDPLGYFKYVMYQGESITTNGVKISVINSGDFDTVRIEKVN